MAWIDNLFKIMTEQKGSDLHLTSEHVPMVRVSGDIVPIAGAPKLSREQLQQVLFEICPERNRKQWEETGDTDFAYALEGIGRFRANYFRDRYGIGAVFRRIPDKILSAEQLGLPPGVMRLCDFKKGLVLVTGPTGSGKSTTLAAMIDHINATRKEHIITIEDPIEFVHPMKQCLVNQREVHNHTKSFAAALRAALREDPDIVLVGEMRDLETTRIAIETAETGHLVFGTLHTSTAASTVDRIINQFPAEEQEQIRLMLAGSLRGVVSQTLLKKKGGGRCAALEILFVTSGIASLIREGKTFQIPSAMQTGAKYGMQLLNDALEARVKSGEVEPLEVWEKAIDKDDIAKRLKALGIDVEAMLEQRSREEKAAKAATQPELPPAGGGAGSAGAAPKPEAPKPPPGSTVLGGQGPVWKRPGT
ncbi:MAG: type IV pilus twitching motility protein PilT [Planctomycetota bacterium]|nr:type IV pilus twitching motility protein PilT [Planctomycetota bacterium]